MAPSTFSLAPEGPFHLSASIGFLSGFRPGGGAGGGPPEHLHLAFVPDGADSPVGVCVRQRDDGVVWVEQYAEAGVVAASAQVARILGLDVDGTGFVEVCRGDPVLGRLWETYDHLRPPSFLSPYEAGAWLLIGHRIRMAQAARIKDAMTAQLGAAVDIHGDRQHAFPAPGVLRAVAEFPGVPERKLATCAGWPMRRSTAAWTAPGCGP